MRAAPLVALLVILGSATNADVPQVSEVYVGPSI